MDVIIRYAHLPLQAERSGLNRITCVVSRHDSVVCFQMMLRGVAHKPSATGAQKPSRQLLSH